MKQTLFWTLGTLIFSGVSVSTMIAPAIAAPQAPILLARNHCITRFYVVKTQNQTALNVRANPNLNAAIVGKLPHGTEVVVNVYDRSSDWAEVSTPKGLKAGWVAARYLQQVTVGGDFANGQMRVRTLDGDRLNLRAQASRNAKVIGKLPNGSRVTFIGFEGDWTKVSVNGLTGFVASQYLVCD